MNSVANLAISLEFGLPVGDSAGVWVSFLEISGFRGSDRQGKSQIASEGAGAMNRRGHGIDAGKNGP